MTLCTHVSFKSEENKRSLGRSRRLGETHFFVDTSELVSCANIPCLAPFSTGMWVPYLGCSRPATVLLVTTQLCRVKGRTFRDMTDFTECVS